MIMTQKYLTKVRLPIFHINNKKIFMNEGISNSLTDNSVTLGRLRIIPFDSVFL